MEWNFTMIRIVQLVFLLWCGVVANAQSNATTAVKSSMHLSDTTSFPATQATSVNSTMLASSTPALPPTPGPMKGGGLRLGVIVGSIVAVAAAVMVVIMIVLAVVRKRKCTIKAKRHSPSVNRGADDFVCEVQECAEIQHSVDRSRDMSMKMSEPHRVSHNFPDTFDKPASPASSRRMKAGTELDGGDIPAAFYNTLADDTTEDWTEAPKSDPKERRSKTLSMRPDLVKKIITINGGNMKIEDIELDVSPGCLAKDTEITLIKDDQNQAFKSLLDLGLIKAIPRVVEFLPDGLKFLKPANLSIKYGKIASDDTELCVLHGSYNRDYQRTVWELVTNDIEDNTADGVVRMKINGFCFFSYIYAKRGELPRILSHLNHSFTCRAYALHRRVPSMDTIDISVVLISKFVDKLEGKNIQQLKDHHDAGYEVGEEGMLKLVHTDRRIEVSLDFPGVENTPFSVKVVKSELDSVGFLIEEFKGTELKYPALGRVLINEVHRHAPNKSLWRLNVRETDEKPCEKKEVEELHTNPDEEETQVEYRTRKLSSKEISRMSRVVGPDWDRLAGLMDIPYCDREEILKNNTKYPDSPSKAKKIFAHFNNDPKFCRHVLQKYLDEMERSDVYSEVLDVQNENEKNDVSQASAPAAPPYENVVLGQTPLSPREMYRLSWKIVQEWDSLAGLMGITNEERQNVRYNLHYKDDRARAEKILSIINCRKDFSRDKLAGGLRDIERLDLIKPITTGEFRNL